ncbi:hypothetical protein FRB90_011805 [Tulasnella sp. 427]|nr:hypothetical protein FRB90_011805 [Tulasnella sp. 427]
MDVDDERLFGGPTSAADPFAPSNGSLQLPPEPSTSPSNSRSSGRSASVAVYSSSTGGAPLSPAPPQSQQAARKRASHGVSSSNQQDSSRRVYPDVYSLPAAVAYAAAHPRRQIPKFGPYLLLQTLGEGEFGKVKLGLHMEYGEEVAVKLIRRGSVDNAVRFSKIEREIEVLRHLKHPNIVRLYDVIETDKYIGIIIEYASGGELFDHILAHRYLREKDAAKLFAQLISGVSYLHAKKIVHRDLKLENLLLDRNRNVIITDFGFANKFEHKADDLMQTSCGSPCYAAPELVISEGLYVGSAVDIWSCGVILYAMLAGYLPFDDDPANPDGDNINLLYKYIINTKLTFPEYVSAEARDLLGLMLVPDPARRCDLEAIKNHSWLQGYTSLFEKTVEDLEAQAMEMQNAKRLQYQKMMRQREKESMPQQKMNRTQSARLETASSASASAIMSSSASTRTGRSHQQHEFLYETGGQDLNPPTTRGGRAVASAIIPTSHASAYDDDPFGAHKTQTEASHARQHHSEHTYDDGSRSRKSSTRSKTSKSPGKTPAVPPPPVQSAQPAKKKGGYRHTIQLEYDDSEQQQQPAVPLPPPIVNGSLAAAHADIFVSSPSVGAPPFPNGIPSVAGSSTADSSIFTSSSANGTTETATSATSHVGMDLDEFGGDGNEAIVPTEITASNREGQDTPKKPSRDAANVTTPKGTKTPSSINVSGAVDNGPPSPTTPKVASRTPSMPPLTTSPPLKRNAATEPSVPTKATLSEQATPLPTPAVPPLPTTSAHDDKVFTTSAISTASSTVSVTPSTSTTSKSSSRHRKGLSLDKFNLNKFLGGDSSEKRSEPKTPTASSKKSVDHAPPTAFDPKSVPPSASPSQNPETASTKSKASRRKTLTLMMGEQFGTAKGTRDKSKAHRSVTGPMNAPSEPALPIEPRVAPVKEAPQTADVNGSFSEKPGTSATKPALATPPIATDAIHDMGPNASTGKAKKVMDWFRKRSLAKNAGDSAFAVQPPSDPHRPAPIAPFEVRSQDAEPLTPTAETYRSKETGDSSTASTPQVVVTAVEGLQPPTWGPAPRSASGQSHASTDTSVSAQSGAKGPSATSTPAASSSSHVPVAKRAAEALANVAFRNPPATAATKVFNKAMLRVHHGAVDQATITTGSPPEVFEHVTQVLISMGIELQKESEFKYRCIRHKRKKNAASSSGMKDSSTNSSLSAFNMSGSAASNGVDRRGLPLPSSNSFGSTGGMLRGLLMRRGSHSPAPQFATPGLEDEERAPVEVPEGAPKEPIYGDRTIDMQDEVRFSVELTRIDRLEDTFSLDIRRLKGNLRSYKFLYDTLRERATPAQ